MNLDKLAAVLVGIVMLAASTGYLPKLIFAVRKAQLQFIQETKASRWGQLPLITNQTSKLSSSLW